MTSNSEKLHMGTSRSEIDMRDVFSGEMFGKNAFVPTLIVYASRDGERSSEEVAKSVVKMFGGNVTVDRATYFGPDTPPGGDNARIRISVPQDEAPFLGILEKNIRAAGNTISADLVERSKTEFFEKHAVPTEVLSFRVPARTAAALTA